MGYLLFTNKRCYVIVSVDHGHNWSDWIPAHGGLPFSSPFGRVVAMPDGKLLLPLWMSERPAGPDLGTDRQPFFSGYLTSTDGGKTWGDVVKLGRFGETSLLLLPDKTTLLACLKQKPSRLTHVMRSVNAPSRWTQPKHFGVQGKNASLHLSPSGRPLILCSPVTPGPGEGTRPGTIYYVSDEGQTWREGVRLQEPIGPKETFAYGVSAVNLDDRNMLVVFYSADPEKPEKGDSPWSSSRNYLAVNIVEETVE